MKKTIFIATLILVALISASCHLRSNLQNSSYNLSNNTKSQNQSRTDEVCFFPTTYATEEEFLSWLESEENFNEKYSRLYKIDKVRFKLKKIPEGYNFEAITVQPDLTTYNYKKADEEVYLIFSYQTMYYFDLYEGSNSITFEQTIHNYDKVIQKDNKTYYVTYPKTVNDEVLRGYIVWNIDNYRCAIYTEGIKSYDDSIFDYCDYEKVPLK